ncbi:copper-containing nitrite reductase [Luteimonas sp. FCS-9]|uniref:copper-containing nitrite reductase n=1 Tax=Luteimonas sp. FCS-9 TaxID=1547516 RepID=UPI00063E8850|nr:copper-containing nitrite reductase [Luteimonas sp. FCS-9]KLJ01093.1 nitrite reductase [Luteimonas sp. FCS-9]
MHALKTSLLAAAIALAASPLLSSPAQAVDAKDLVNATLSGASELANLPRQRVELKRPPFVHDHEQVAKGGPKVVQFTLPIVEKEIVIDGEGTKLHAMTFGGSVPGPLMVVHEGDYVELTLVNPSTNSMVHNIDFHAATGALGGGDLTVIQPGEEVVLRWKATRPGTFVYHCAPGGPMTPWHVVSGMQGTVMVLPRDGLKDGDGKSLRYDRAYYVGETDFYVPRDADGNFKTYGSHAEALPDTLATMKSLTPSHVVFNGAVGALTGEQAMTSKVGETILLVHSQANRDSRPHLIGGHGDYVWEEGKFNNAPLRDLETWFIRGGSAGAALYTFRQPGLYVYLNHNLIEAVLLGAAAHIKVDGDKWNHDLMTTPSPVGPIKPGTSLALPADK